MDRRLSALAAAAIMFATAPGAMVVVSAGIAEADVCGSVGGRRVSVSGCADIADTVADYVPPPAYYAPLPEDPPPPVYAPPPPPPPPLPNVTVCANVGRRINVSACT